MEIAHSAAGTTARAGHEAAETDTPRLLDTYALTYAFGIMWLAVAVILLGGQKAFAFDGVYGAILSLPPLVTAGFVLAVEPRGRWSTFPLRALVLAVVCSIVSALSTVPLTPLLVLMFREGVTGHLAASGLVATIALVVVASPLVVGVVAFVRRGQMGRAAILAAGILVTGIALAMAISPAGALAASLRVDQGEIAMITSTWWLPFYALAAAFSRRWGLA